MIQSHNQRNMRLWSMLRWPSKGITIGNTFAKKKGWVGPVRPSDGRGGAVHLGLDTLDGLDVAKVESVEPSHAYADWILHWCSCGNAWLPVVSRQLEPMNLYHFVTLSLWPCLHSYPFKHPCFTVHTCVYRIHPYTVHTKQTKQAKHISSGCWQGSSGLPKPSARLAQTRPSLCKNHSITTSHQQAKIINTKVWCKTRARGAPMVKRETNHK